MVAEAVAVAVGSADELCCPNLVASPLSEAEAGDLARAFAALADPVRLRLLSLMASAPAGQVCACELVGPVGRSQPTVSHHLKVLTEAGLITGDKRGRWVWYAVVPERLAMLQGALRP
ncbi:MAG: metalloregulator ArsR/SmtB family transcription factor [Actinomycetota bacterium]|nr:metalloregulator ArsR/SmtB family transcription factor [Actinomycetota bacterium]MDQ3679550.1 metalloregulator ArsR/SmtB family transcription factor [Actinomycetota bacterium]